MIGAAPSGTPGAQPMASIAFSSDDGLMRSTMAVWLVMVGCGAGGADGLDGRAADAPVDVAVAAPACATSPMTMPATPRRPWALAIATDGTTYVASNDSGHRVDRWRPGQSGFDSAWYEPAAEQHLWALAVDDAGTLYVGAGDGLWRVEPTTSPPRATLLDRGQTRAVTIGPGGEPYYTSLADGAQRVKRWSDGRALEVSRSMGGEPSDLLFDVDGTLLVADLLNGLDRLTLDDQRQQTSIASVLEPATERINTVARDADGGYYVGFTFRDGLERYDPTFTSRLGVLSESPILDVAFARGHLGCGALYAVSSNSVVMVEAAGPGTP